MPATTSTQSAETRRKVVEMYDRGEKLTKIEKETGLSRGGIYFILKDAGVEPVRAQARTRINRNDPVATMEWAFARLLEQERLIGKLTEECSQIKQERDDLLKEVTRLRARRQS